MDKKPKAKLEKSADHSKTGQEIAVQHQHDTKEKEHSDNSSMVVLARTKRKHRRQGEESVSNISGDSTEKRVRIQEGGDPSNVALENQREQDAQESSNSTSSTDLREDAPQDDEANMVPLAHVVTDISSSNRTDSNVSNSNNSGSGSGSGGNSGEGSNQGSSGSGNEGKGSSEELPKEGSNEGSVNSGKNKEASSLGSDRSPATKQPPPLGNVAPQDNVKTATEREQKLLDKKRKRIEMRREYEAQQELESSDSSRVREDQLLRPGNPVSLDQVMGFSTIPR